jgi:hypothetical protein
LDTQNFIGKNQNQIPTACYPRLWVVTGSRKKNKPASNEITFVLFIGKNISRFASSARTKLTIKNRFG